MGYEWDLNCMSAVSAFIKGEIIAHNWKKKPKQIVLEQFLEGKLFIMFIGKWLNYDQYSGLIGSCQAFEDFDVCMCCRAFALLVHSDIIKSV